ncbi:MAG: hypothetical protein LBH43_11975 [Treponema sp.]|jgi:hypothetical protein|nr:hypothetical protein [Treponema sp.]
MKENKIEYSVFANKEWIGPSFKTVDEAKTYAKAKGLTVFGIYKCGVNHISDAVYEEDNGDTIMSVIKMVMEDPVGKWSMLRRAGFAFTRAMTAQINRYVSRADARSLAVFLKDELTLIYGNVNFFEDKSFEKWSWEVFDGVYNAGN